MSNLMQTPTKPSDKIFSLVIAKSFSCTEKAKPFLQFQDKKKNNQHEHLILFEFVYFFMHMINRHALPILGHGRRAQLQSKRGPEIIKSITEVVFESEPEELKTQLFNDIYENLNRAEIGYANCKELLLSSNPFSQDAIISKLARLVSNLCTYPTDKNLIWTVMETSFQEYQKTYFNRLLESCRTQLDDPTVN